MVILTFIIQHPYRQIKLKIVLHLQAFLRIFQIENISEKHKNIIL